MYEKEIGELLTYRRGIMDLKMQLRCFIDRCNVKLNSEVIVLCETDEAELKGQVEAYNKVLEFLGEPKYGD